MNKKLLIFVFLLAVLSRLNITAQENQSQFSYGLHLGPSFSGFTHNYEVFSQLKTGFSGGVFAEYKFIPSLGVSLDLDYLMEGAFHVSPYLVYPASSIVYTGGSVYKQASDITIHDIHIPILINIRPITTGVSPTLSLGYAFDFFLTAQTKDMIIASGTQTMALSERSSENVSSSFQTWNMGPVAGVGINFPGIKYNYSFDLRYKVGIRDINNLAGLNELNGQHNFSMNTFIFYITIAKK